MSILFFCIVGLLTSGTFAAEKPSLKSFQARFLYGVEVTQELKKKQIDKTQIQKLLQKNQQLRLEFFQHVKQSSAFVRGEIDDEKTLNFLVNFLQLSLLRLRVDWDPMEIVNWFHFAADLSYEESTLVGIRLAGVIRSLLLDEIENQLPQNPQQFVNAGSWIKSLRAPWPVDRVVLFESKRVLKPQALAIAEKVAVAFQKNPYQTAEAVLAKIPGGKTAELEFLKAIWRDADLKAMKTEINRLGLLKARAAQIQFVHSQKKSPNGWADLTQWGGLESVPIDYFTGRPMEWSQLAAAGALPAKQNQ